MFADHGPAWPLSVFQSVDVQIAAADLTAIETGEFLTVVGDFHPGNPLTQALFSTRFPGPERFREIWHADVGQPIVTPILMRSPGMRLSARNIPDATNPDDIHLRGAGITPVHLGHKSLQIADLVVRGEDVLDPAGGFRAPLIDSTATARRRSPASGSDSTKTRSSRATSTWSRRSSETSPATHA